MAPSTATVAFDRLEQELLALPESHRSELAASLLHSLPIPEGILEEGTPEFEMEIERRCKEIEDGTATLLPYETVMRELRQVLQNG